MLGSRAKQRREARAKLDKTLRDYDAKREHWEAHKGCEWGRNAQSAVYEHSVEALMHFALAGLKPVNAEDERGEGYAAAEKGKRVGEVLRNCQKCLGDVYRGPTTSAVTDCPVAATLLEMINVQPQPEEIEGAAYRQATELT